MLTGIRAWLVGGAIVASIALVAYLDLLTGRPYNFSIFYVVPTAAAGWYVGRTFGVVVGVLSGLSWDITDYVIRTNDPAAYVWNGLTRVAVFGGLAALTAKLRELLAQLRRSQSDLQALLAQRDEFLSMVAHELRAPVAAIETVATGLLRAQELAPRERRALGQLQRQARDLAGLAEGLLAASQLEAGTMRLEPESVDLAEVARELEATHARVRARASGPTVVTVDSDAIRRALAALVSNALKFSPPDSPVDVVVHPGAGGVFVRIVDRGVGLDDEEAALLFRKYSRVPRSAAAAEGVGLGLYFARLLVEAHQGSISVESAGPGLGSTFTVWLPLRPALVPSAGAERTA